MEENKEVEVVKEESKNTKGFMDKVNGLYEKGTLNKILFALLVTFFVIVLIFAFQLNNLVSKLQIAKDIDFLNISGLFSKLGALVSVIKSIATTHGLYLFLGFVILILFGFNVYKAEDKKLMLLKPSNLFTALTLFMSVVVEVVGGNLFKVIGFASKVIDAVSNGLKGLKLDALNALSNDPVALEMQKNSNMLNQFKGAGFKYLMIFVLLVFVIVTAVAVYANYLNTFKKKELNLTIIKDNKEKSQSEQE